MLTCIRIEYESLDQLKLKHARSGHTARCNARHGSMLCDRINGSIPRVATGSQSGVRGPGADKAGKAGWTSGMPKMQLRHAIVWYVDLSIDI